MFDTLHGRKNTQVSLIQLHSTYYYSFHKYKMYKFLELTTSPAVAAVICTTGASPSGRQGPRSRLVISYIQKKVAAVTKKITCSSMMQSTHTGRHAISICQHSNWNHRKSSWNQALYSEGSSVMNGTLIIACKCDRVQGSSQFYD